MMAPTGAGAVKIEVRGLRPAVGAAGIMAVIVTIVVLVQ